MRGGQKPESANEMMTEKELDQALAARLKELYSDVDLCIQELATVLSQCRAKAEGYLKYSVDECEEVKLARSRLRLASAIFYNEADDLVEELAGIAGWSDLYSGHITVHGTSDFVNAAVPAHVSGYICHDAGSGVHPDGWFESEEDAVKAVLKGGRSWFNVWAEVRCGREPSVMLGTGVTINKALKDCGNAGIRLFGRPVWTGIKSVGSKRAKEYLLREDSTYWHFVPKYED